MTHLAISLAAAFNLICSGSTYFGTNLKDSTPFETTLRVDLDGKRWCSNSCSSTSQIEWISPTQIVFENESEPLVGTLHMVNRESGDYIYRVRTSALPAGLFILNTGKCKRATFTGFPTPKF